MEPLLAALKSAEQRIARAAQPRLSGVQRAIAKDLARIKAASAIDVPNILAKLDEAVRAVDELPMANGVPQRSKSVAPARATSQPTPSSISERASDQFQAWWLALKAQTADLVRLSRIDAPEASLVAPEQAYMLRENLKLKLLNARLGVLARQNDAARADLRLAAEHIVKYGDGQAKRTLAMLANLSQVQGLLQASELPRPDDSLAALKLAGAAR
jgi:uroporphyrin-3 C-methyltransferase